LIVMTNERGVLRRSTHIDATDADGRALEVLKALGSEPRLQILRYLGDRVVSVNQIGSDLGIPASTAAMHVGVLEEAGLIHCELRPATRGLRKVCSRSYDEVVVALPRGERHARRSFELSMPVGAYSDVQVEPTCGLAGPTGLIGLMDDPASFYEPDRLEAQLIWFRAGHVEYRFPNRVPPGATIEALTVTAEVCSEAPLHDADWPSDISVWINDVHLGAWTCPGDFGGTRGRLTPSWWDERDSQFGVLKRWRVSRDGSTIDGVDLSGVTLEGFALSPGQPINIRLGVHPDAANVGGINLFGRGFGNSPQDVTLRIEYDLVGDDRDAADPAPST
jgi:predicted transcriptional regulator